MPRHNASNERIKREYFTFLKEAKGRDVASMDRVAASIARFEDSTRRKDFKTFHREQAMAFKRKLGEAVNARSGERLSKATVHATLRDLKAFFQWLAREPGYRSKIHYSDADYFNLSDKDVAIARAKREKRVASVEQLEHVLQAMPAESVLERRNRALVAFAAMTAIRVDAMASLKLKHVDMARGFLDQDAREVRTKFSKTIGTFLMPVVDGALPIVRDWIAELEREHLWGPNDPLFPLTLMGLGPGGGFQPMGIARKGWASTGPIRDIFRNAFEAAGLPYFNPHSFRNTLARHAEKHCRTPEELKAWSQNLGHNDVLTTLISYGKVPLHRQGELIRAQLGELDGKPDADTIAALEAALAALKGKAA